MNWRGIISKVVTYVTNSPGATVLQLGDTTVGSMAGATHKPMWWNWYTQQI